ncbi:type II toxin-antitoxin system death-on-curing family toxin [Cryobacterium sp. TMT2-18-3]|uniref:type II toxin-antitoxin system death-on-curing family toxin n=1 Tax=unclassified Cryobacterium TaxID=2649013 RepID=UPI001069C86F|nr:MULTISPECIES: type II toxin-antitoxin system death-on-curing family toxin [unclassified Cryobacterium]TFC24327.1 type II toxin-antitoxin system death-on-curing family toxin [Cryobacterium sp. TMT2-18-2]TFC39606.1 type II toxin-antitoxin system death-on-curing family toxin [Cryobacterium sp. TMT2-42-4]TFC61267.1 type II toxin-antitoxin system death-on-curing family toxin [Cryobacterium sp. TMT2-18-3]
MIYLTYADLLYVGQRALGGDMPVRDQGLLESALARPRASAFETDAYGSLNEKAAALTHSVARNHGLIDGNKRLSLAALITFLGMNGRRLTWSNDEAYEFIMDVASGRLDDVSDIAKRIDLGSDER